MDDRQHEWDLLEQAYPAAPKPFGFVCGCGEVLAGALESIAPSTGQEPGLVHEPAPGEVAPPGYAPTPVRAPRLGVTAGLD